MTPQPNPIRSTNLPGIDIGDVGNIDTPPPANPLLGKAVDAGGGPPITVPTGTGGAVGASTLVASGASIATINAALVTGDVTLSGTYTITSPILMPSNRTLHLVDSTVTLANGANCALIQNSNLAGGNTNIHVRGYGHAVLDGNCLNQVRQVGNEWKTNGINLGRVTTYSLRNFTLNNVECYGICPSLCSDWVIADIDCTSIGTLNQCVVQLMGANSRFVIERIRGQTGDDAIALFAAATYGNFSPTGTAAGDIINGAVRDIRVASGSHVVRLLNGDGSLIRHIDVSRVRRPTNTTANNIRLGEDSYATVQPGNADMRDITIRDVEGRIIVSQSLTDLVIDGVVWPTENILNVAVEFIGRDVTHQRTCTNVTISNVFVGPEGAGLYSVVKVNQFVTLNTCSLDGVLVASADAILDNRGTVNRITVRNVTAAYLETGIIRSTVAENTGMMDAVYVAQWGGSAKRYGTVATKLQLGVQMPAFISTDQTPVATEGSFARCDATKVLDGGAATPAVYCALGGAWTRL